MPLERTHARYASQGLVIIAVHTLEFDGEAIAGSDPHRGCGFGRIWRSKEIA